MRNSTNRKGKREYLNDSQARDLVKDLNQYFQRKMRIPRMRMGDKQEIETLVNEEAQLFARYVRDEKNKWIPRIVVLTWNRAVQPKNIKSLYFVRFIIDHDKKKTEKGEIFKDRLEVLREHTSYSILVFVSILLSKRCCCHRKRHFSTWPEGLRKYGYDLYNHKYGYYHKDEYINRISALSNMCALACCKNG